MERDSKAGTGNEQSSDHEKIDRQQKPTDETRGKKSTDKPTI